MRTRSTCDFCRERQYEKKCSGCQRKFYCSDHCQSADWPIHKAICVPCYTIDTNMGCEERRTINRALSRWITRWRKPLGQYATNAFDITNNLPRILMSHVVTIRIEGRGTSSRGTPLFQIQRGLLLPVDGVVELLWGLEAERDLIARFQRDLAGGPSTPTGRLVIQYEEQILRLYRFPVDIDHSPSKSCSASLASTWELDLIQTIEAGRMT